MKQVEHLIVERKEQELEDRQFVDVPELVEEEDFNDTYVGYGENICSEHERKQWGRL